jgi:hypothetical protein
LSSAHGKPRLPDLPGIGLQPAKIVVVDRPRSLSPTSTQHTGKALRWRVVLLDAEGGELARSGWQELRVGAAGS